MRVVGVLLVALLAASCGSPSGSPAAATPSSTPLATRVVSTACPPNGTARAAILTPITKGTHPTVVYNSEPPANGGPFPQTLIRYDVTTASKDEIVTTAFDAAQVPPDGQWIELVTSSAGRPAIQLVGMDGTHLQTLYCGEPNGNVRGLLWSPGEDRLLLSSSRASGSPTVYLLDTVRGTLQAMLGSSDPSVGYAPYSWLDGSRLLVVGRPTGPGPGLDLRILDLSQGANQQSSRLPEVLSTTAGCWDADTDGTTLYTSECNGAFSDLGGGVWRGPSDISSEPVSEGQKHLILSIPTLAVTQLRAAGRDQLLMSVGNQDPAQSASAAMNGLWKLNSDGSGLTQLVPSPGKQGMSS